MAPERMQRAEAEFRKQFPTEQEYKQVVQNEVHGSKQLLREKIRRSLLIEDMLKTEVNTKARVTEAAALAYYKANPKNFQRPEMFSIQTISIVPPANPTPEMAKEARKKAENAAEAGESDEELPGVRAAGREDFRGRLAREHGRPQGGGARTSCRRRWSMRRWR